MEECSTHFNMNYYTYSAVSPMTVSCSDVFGLDHILFQNLTVLGCHNNQYTVGASRSPVQATAAVQVFAGGTFG